MSAPICCYIADRIGCAVDKLLERGKDGDLARKADVRKIPRIKFSLRDAEVAEFMRNNQFGVLADAEVDNFVGWVVPNTGKSLFEIGILGEFGIAIEITEEKGLRLDDLASLFDEGLEFIGDADKVTHLEMVLGEMEIVKCNAYPHGVLPQSSSLSGNMHRCVARSLATRFVEGWGYNNVFDFVPT